MKKPSATAQNKETERSAAISSSAAPAATDRSEAEDPTASLQADLDRFRDLALRS